MFYTKYRPQKFNDISKPNEITQALMRQVVSNKISHAYLFVGSRGTGKTTTARIMAKALNCEHLQKDGDPCDTCDNCLAVKSGMFLDLIEIDAASNRGIDDIRELKDRIKLAPLVGRNKVYIIDEVHMLTTEAFNALLKTLEEPPKNVIFVLCTTEIHKVPDTIKSRCQVFKFKRATINQITKKLQEICSKEGVTLEDDKLRKIAEASLGSFRDAETLLQQIIEGGMSINSLLTLSSKAIFYDFVDALFNKDVSFALKLVNKATQDGLDLYVWNGELVKYLRDLLFSNAGVSDLIETNDENLSKIKEQSRQLSVPLISYYLSLFTKAQNEIRNSFITQLPIEMAIVEICHSNRGMTDKKSLEPIIGDGDISKEQSNAVFKIKIADIESHKTEPSKEVAKEILDLESVATRSLSSVTVEHIISKWQDVLKAISEINSSVLALLKSTEIIAIEENIILVKVFYSFHKERLENPKNRKIIEEALDAVFGERISIKCHLSDKKPSRMKKREVGDLTDYNVIQPNVGAGSLVDVFDGGLPLVS